MVQPDIATTHTAPGRSVRSWGLRVVVAALVLSGCSSDGDGAEDAAAAGQPAAAGGPSGGPPPSAETSGAPASGAVAESLVMPVVAYMPTADEYAAVQQAHNMIVQECMEEQGFDWSPPEPTTADVFGRQVTRRYRGVIDQDLAAEYGYHVVPTGNSAATVEEAPLTEAALTALAGDEMTDEPGGCKGEAIEQLSAGTEHLEAGGINLPYPVAEVNLDAYGLSQQDPRVVDALAEWTSCMAERGYEIADPINYPSLTELPGFDIESPRPSAAEVDMALWDVECQERTDLVNIWFEVDSQIQEQMIDERAEVLAQITEENQELFRRAAEVIEGTDG